jgi:DNA primase
MNRWVDFRVLKQSIAIEQVLTSYRIELKCAGHHQLRGLCPLPTHGSERSRQSFSVDTAKNVWACHSTTCCEARQGRVGGNVLDLVAWLEGCTIRDAALRLEDLGCGRREGINVREQQLASKGSSRSRSPDRLPRLTFSLCMRWHPYLEQRGVDPSTAARFGVGYYAGSGFLRHRIVFPIHDSEGQLVAYAGRSIDGSEPRYLFPPGFRKSQVVFNLHRAVGEAAGCAIVVEGFFDCLRVHQAGYRNVVALMGVSLSEMQEKLLLQRFPQLVLMLDGDEAGRRASQQLAARLAGKVSLGVVGVPSGRQPDQLSIEEIDRILCRAGGAAVGSL